MSDASNSCQQSAEPSEWDLLSEYSCITLGKGRIMDSGI